MHSSPLGYRVWHQVHRICETWADNKGYFCGSVEVDKIHMGGNASNPEGERLSHQALIA